MPWKREHRRTRVRAQCALTRISSPIYTHSRVRDRFWCSNEYGWQDIDESQFYLMFYFLLISSNATCWQCKMFYGMKMSACCMRHIISSVWMRSMYCGQWMTTAEMQKKTTTTTITTDNKPKLESCQIKLIIVVVLLTHCFTYNSWTYDFSHFCCYAYFYWNYPKWIKEMWRKGKTKTTHQQKRSIYDETEVFRIKL